MRFLLPVGGVTDTRFGILTTPGHNGVPQGIVAGMDWAADNQAFTQGFDPDVFFPWLESMESYRPTCLFVPVPDVVGDAQATIDNYYRWHWWLRDWPVAFVAQDGQEDLALPVAGWSTLFVGGSTEWKVSGACQSVIERAQKAGKHIHIGRVNWWRRYAHFRGLSGSDTFTCDGTRTRFDGTARTVEAWSDYMERQYQMRLL